MKKIAIGLAFFVAVGGVSITLFSCSNDDEHYGYKYIGEYDTMKECYEAVTAAGFQSAMMDKKACYAQ